MVFSVTVRFVEIGGIVQIAIKNMKCNGPIRLCNIQSHKSFGVIAIKTYVFFVQIVMYDKKWKNAGKALQQRTNVVIMWTIWRVGPTGSAGRIIRKPTSGSVGIISSFLNFELWGERHPPRRMPLVRLVDMCVSRLWS